MAQGLQGVAQLAEEGKRQNAVLERLATNATPENHQARALALDSVSHRASLGSPRMPLTARNSSSETRLNAVVPEEDLSVA